MKNNIKHKMQFVCCTLSILFLFYGINRGEVEITLNKAVNICLECIGLG